MTRLITYTVSLFLAFIMNASYLVGQTSVGINTQTPNANAVLELVSLKNDQGLLITRMSDVERTNLGKKLNQTETGLMVFNTSDTMFYFWTGKVWQKGLADLSSLYSITTALTDSSSSYYNEIQNLIYNTNSNSYKIDTLKADVSLLKIAIDKLVLEQTLAAILEKGNAANAKITNLTAPTDAQDATTKKYVDDSVSALRIDVTNINTDISNLYDSVTNINNDITNLYDSVININNDISNLYDSVTNINNDITNLYDSVTNINNDITNLYDSVTTINTDISNLYDSVTNINNDITNLYDSVININNDISNLYDSVTNINNDITNLFDSITNITQVIKMGNFNLEELHVFVGDADDTAKAVSLNGAIAIVDVFGKTEIQAGVIRASNLGASPVGAVLDDGTLDYVLTSTGDGTFKWTNPSTAPVDPNNISLAQGSLFVGNSSNKAGAVLKNTIPLSGFSAAVADVEMGTYKITGLGNPIDAQDATTKKYVDDSVSVLRGNITNLYDSVININTDISNLYDSVTNINNDITNLYDSVININTDISNLYDSVTNINNDITNLFDSITNITQVIKMGNFNLEELHVFVGDADDTAKAVSLNGAIAIVDVFGKTEIQAGVIRASNLGASPAGAVLGDGTLDYVLTSTGNGAFKWTNPSTAPVDPNNISLNQGSLFVGNASNKAGGVVKTSIPLSGFGAAEADIALGAHKITGLSNPTAAQDAATKFYVDAEVANAGNINLADGAILIGNATGKAVPRILAGDMTITNSGVAAIGTAKVTSDMILDGTILTSDIHNNAVTYSKIQDLSTPNKLLGSSSTTNPVQEITIGTGLSMIGSTLNAADGTVTGVSIVTGNGFAGTVATSTATPAISLSTTVTGLLKGQTGAIVAAVAGTDYTTPTSTLHVGTTSIALNRASAAQSLTGITSIDGSAATLTTPRAINGTNFDGSAPITVPVNSVNDNTNPASVYPLWTSVAGNSQANISNTKLSFIPNTGILTATGFAGNITGNVTGNVSGTSTNVTGVVAVANGGTGLSSTVANQLLYSSSASVITGLTTANGGILNTSSTGVPSITATPTLGVAGTTAGKISFAGATSGTVTLQSAPAAGNAILTLPSVTGTLALTNGSITSDNVPRWDGNKLINSTIWCNTNGANTRLYLGSVVAPPTYTYDLEVAGSFKTTKIYHASDARWKKNVKTFDNALETVQKLRGVTYEWKTDEFPLNNFSTGTQIGLIAQEVEAVIPELVNTGADGYKAVEYANLVSVLVEAIKEQQLMISAQEKEIEKLQKDVLVNTHYVQQIKALQEQMGSMQSQIVSLSSLVQLIAPTASSNK